MDGVTDGWGQDQVPGPLDLALGPDPVHFPSVFFSELCVDSAGDVRTDPEYR